MCFTLSQAFLWQGSLLPACFREGGLFKCILKILNYFLLIYLFLIELSLF